jgi:hypothetical protein
MVSITVMVVLRWMRRSALAWSAFALPVAVRRVMSIKDWARRFISGSP